MSRSEIRVAFPDIDYFKGISLQQAAAAAEELRRVLSRTEFGKREAPLSVTCSFGVSEWQAGDTIDHLLRRADVALYDAKLAGRNQVMAADARFLEDRHEDRRGVVRAAARRNNH
jgi:GGDEF domain-containing protein